MSGSVLYDAPGPRTVARHRVYTVVTVAVLVALAAGLVWKMQVEGQFAYDDWEPFVTPAYIEALLVDGLLRTLQMAFGAILLAVVFGLVLGVGKLSEHGWLRWPSWVVVEFFRATPVLLLMVFIFLFLAIGDRPLTSLQCVVVALMLYNGSVLAEVFRAGVNAVPRGQVEAAYALGMRKTQVMMTIQLPQAVKIMLPAIISQCVVALKDTSLGFYILAPGLTAVARQIWIDFQNHVQAAIVLAAIYILVNLVVSAIATAVQHRLVGERSPLETTEVEA